MNESITVKCPACANEFPLSEGILSSVREELSNELKDEIIKRETALTQRQEAFRQEQASLKRERGELQDKVDSLVEERLSKQVIEIRAKAEQEAARKAAETNALALKALQQERDEQNAAMKKANSEQLRLLADVRKLQEANDNMELENRRKLAAERKTLRNELQQKADEDYRLRIAEKEKVISDLQVKLQDATRRAEQGSMQTQGAVLELDFEQQLRLAFPLDRVTPIATGARGADISQEVISRTGRSCGTILFETKRTKAWQDKWISKLHGDMRQARADAGVLVTQVLPKDIDRFGQKEGVWVADYTSAIPLAHVLRTNLREVMIAKGHREGAKEKMEMLYEYLTGNDFRQRVQLVIDAFTTMRGDLDKERSYIANKWNKREKQINLVIENMSGMVGDVQALSGGAVGSMPAIDSDDDTGDEDEDADAGNHENDMIEAEEAETAAAL